jgi:hypothetical protein
MGQNVSHKTNAKVSTIRELQEQPLSDFYLACRDGNIEKVKKLLPSMSIEQIDQFEPNGSTALHAASYHGHAEIVQILLASGACRSLRNLRYNLTPYEEACNDDIRRLFSRIDFPSQARFIGSSSKTEWSLDTSYAAEWKTHLSKLLQPELSFQEIILFLQKNYFKDYVNLSSSEFERINFLFHRAYNENDARFIVKAYTTPTQFYAIVNIHLAEYLLKCFRFDDEQNIIEQCVAHLASIFIHRSELRYMTFTGTVYRGLLLFQSDLETYRNKKCLLNKAFLSTSKEPSVASIYAGFGDQTKMRTTIGRTPLQYTALCIYKIINVDTALDISSISEFPLEHEVLIMPLCAFQVQSVRRNDEDNNDIQFEIVLEECDQSMKLKRKNIQQKTRPRVT